MALVGDFIPKRWQGLYTGINQLSIGFSVIISGLFAEILLSSSAASTSNLSRFSDSELLMLLSFAVVLVLLLLQFSDKILESMP